MWDCPSARDGCKKMSASISTWGDFPLKSAFPFPFEVWRLWLRWPESLLCRADPPADKQALSNRRASSSPHGQKRVCLASGLRCWFPFGEKYFSPPTSIKIRGERSPQRESGSFSNTAFLIPSPACLFSQLPHESALLSSAPFRSSRAAAALRLFSVFI